MTSVVINQARCSPLEGMAGGETPTALARTSMQQLALSDYQSVACRKQSCSRSFDTEHGESIHFAQSHETTRDMIADDIQRVGDIVNGTPRKREMNEHGLFSDTTVQNYFDSWNAAIEYTGFDPNIEHNIKRIIQCDWCGNDLPPREPNEIERHDGNYHTDCYAEYRETFTGEQSQFYIDGRAKETPDYYGSFQIIAEEVRERDQCCRSCGFPRSRYTEQYDIDLDVHHVTPFGWFAKRYDGQDLYRRAHEKSNLLAMCRWCHMRWERIETRPITIDQFVPTEPNHA